MEEEEEGEAGTAAEVEAALGLRRTRRAGLLLLAVLVGEGASMRAEKEEEACRVVVVDWGMRVPARRTATPGGGIRKAWVVCVSPMVVRARRTASTRRRDVARLCMLLLW